MRPSIRWRIVIPMFILLLLTLGGLGIFLSEYLYNSFVDFSRSQLLNEARGLLTQITYPLDEDAPYPLLNRAIHNYSKLLDVRITLILANGTVIADSDVDAQQLENHFNRPEIKAALNGSEFSDIRFSTTLQMRMLYAAVPVVKNGQTVGALRLAISMQRIDQNIRVIQNTILIVTGLILLFAILLVIIVTGYAIKPLGHFTQRVQQMAGGEIQVLPLPTQADEIGQLTVAFNHLAYQLKAQIGALQNERSKLSAVLNNMNDGILIVEPNGLVNLINPAAARFFQITVEQALGHSLTEVVRHHQLIELWKKCQMTGEQQVTLLETSPDRQYLQGIAITLDPAIPGSILLIMQDLTRLRRLENVRRDFVSNVSHELRTPLASLKAITETLQEGALEDPPAARRFLIRMEGEIDNLTQMVQELLELSRIESGKVPLEKRVTSPKEMIAKAVDRMQMQAERASLTIATNCPDGLPSIYVDFTRMEQVFINLLHNAIKFTPPGGKITVSAYREASLVVFAVQDTGVGIDPQALPRIFERFYKADKARSGGGTGLGLSIARHLVEAHSGRIWAESTFGQGSTFYIALPISGDK